jgi:hypothetical protein
MRGVLVETMSVCSTFGEEKYFDHRRISPLMKVE